MKDVRSTGRRRARKTLFEAYVPFKCAGYDSPVGHVDCGKTSMEPPKDAPSWFEEIWPEENRVLTSSLQADHVTKDLTINEVEFLEWRCVSCHKMQDKQTAVGESQIDTSRLW